MFSDGKLPDDWTVTSGEWEVVDGALTADASGELATLFFGDPDQQNYEISAKITFDAVDKKSPWASLIFRAGEEGELPFSQVSAYPNVKDKALIKFAVQTASKKWAVRGSGVLKEKPFELGKARELRVVVRGTKVEAYLDGKKLLQSVFCVDRDQGCLGLAANHCRVTFDEVTIRTLSPSKRVFSKLKRKPCGVVAHRGYSAIAPENTLSAIREAIKAGSHGCEFDIYSTKDGQIVLLHDRTVDRTTNGKGKIAELNFDYVRGLDAGSWKDKKFTGEQIPTLDEALAVLKDSGCIPVIEIKIEGISRQVVEAVRRAEMLDQTAVIAFSGKVVKEIRELEPNLPCYWLWSKGLKGKPKERAATIVREAAKHGTNMVDLNYNMLSDEVLRELKRRGMKVWCWTINDPAVMDALMRWGVEGLTTDRPNDAVRLIKEIKK